MPRSETEKNTGAVPYQSLVGNFSFIVVARSRFRFDRESVHCPEPVSGLRADFPALPWPNSMYVSTGDWMESWKWPVTKWNASHATAP